MTIIRLPAGADLAEMALFDVDALPGQPPRDSEGFAELTAQQRLVRFPSGGDGAFLLQLVVNESIPEETMRYCQIEDKLTGGFHTSEGRIGFGGIESTYAGFEPNPYIRADRAIEPGSYTYTVYTTDFPDQMVMKALQVERTAASVG